ncbi:hypothetical protein [Silanimonas sp.]|uniref:hypothetical protein n=1 Tax=Silanimonas sp. TaxID=1929290 RepID=UPI0022CB3E2C|nr:hypothetical protein [Silanimonas sp.]MCZ8164112.1 hypothetical protein [Silanimonas sp.]
MTLNKKILAAAIVGGLFATAAQAQVNLSATGGSTPVTFASELIISNPTNGLAITNAANALDLAANLRYNFSENEVRYARVECSSNVRFSAGSAVTLGAGTGVAGDLTGATIGAINGLGTNVITFSITSGTGLLKSVNTLTINGNRNITATTAGSCSYSLYDQPSQAAAGGTAGLITTLSGNYISFAQSYGLAVLNPRGAVANVEASPSFSRFVSAAPTSSVDRGNIGTIVFDTRANVAVAQGSTATQPRLANGVAATLADLLDADSTHSIAGDFSAAANSNGTFSGAALSRVYFSVNADCSTVDVAANAVTATSARFDTGATAVNASLCYAPRTGVAIPASGYAQTFNAVSADTALYSVTSLGPVTLGSITRNGTTLQAPFVQLPAGWLSRVVLTNTGSVARPYTIAAQTETGTTAALGSAATGTIPAGGTIVLSVSDIVSFTGNSRGTLVATVAGPNNDIQGLYQIVNGVTGSIANTAMQRPGTN